MTSSALASIYTKRFGEITLDDIVSLYDAIGPDNSLADGYEGIVRFRNEAERSARGVSSGVRGPSSVRPADAQAFRIAAFEQPEESSGVANRSRLTAETLVLARRQIEGCMKKVEAWASVNAKKHVKDLERIRKSLSSSRGQLPDQLWSDYGDMVRRALVHLNQRQQMDLETFLQCPLDLDDAGVR